MIYFNLADMLKEQGKIEGAINFCEKAVVILEPFYDEHPQDIGISIEMGIICTLIAKLYRQKKQMKSAKSYYMKVESILEAAFQSHPDDSQVAEMLGTFYILYGEENLKTENISLLIHYFNKGISIIEPIFEGHLEMMEVGELLFKAHKNLGKIFRGEANVEKAREHFESAKVLAEFLRDGELLKEIEALIAEIARDT